MADFIPGIELSRLFFFEAVKPVLDAEFPRLRCGAALIGTGSEVLGFDTEMSADHHWGPRVDLFFGEDDYEGAHEAVRAALSRKLPHRFRGYPTSFTEPDPTDKGVQHLVARDAGEVTHKVEVKTPRHALRRDVAGARRTFLCRVRARRRDAQRARHHRPAPDRAARLLRSPLQGHRASRLHRRAPVANHGRARFSDSTDLISHAGWRATLRKLYE
ncbi:MAG: hypothetical protein DMF66_03990 [Acidobacteria bacterium]|nr:MAG: hypothetical protein DMF66_03990 [Acidobacteriota bacterium]